MSCKLNLIDRDATRIAMRNLTTSVMKADSRIVVVSVMRAGIPVGEALSRALQSNGLATQHYSLYFKRDSELTIPVGMHGWTTVVIDGWIGTGDTMRILRRRLEGPDLYFGAMVDPAGLGDIRGTRDDLFCPHATLFDNLDPNVFSLQPIPEEGTVRVANRSFWRLPWINRYVELLTSFASTSCEEKNGPQRRIKPQPPCNTNTRAHWRVGLNECWRGWMRRELDSIIVNSTIPLSVAARDLLNTVDLTVSYADIGPWCCVGRVATRQT